MKKHYLPFQTRALDFFKDYVNSGLNFGNNTHNIEYVDRKKIFNIWVEQLCYFTGYDKPKSRAEIFSNLYQDEIGTLEQMCHEHCSHEMECATPYHCDLRKEYVTGILKEMNEMYQGTVLSYRGK